MLLAFDDEWDIARRLAAARGCEAALIERHRFPDGELKLRLPPQLPAHVALYRSLAAPNEKLVELLLAADTARQFGASRLTLVAPYLGYMRQDIAFRPGEAVSQKIVGRFLARLFDCVITVDPHLHRIRALEEAVPLDSAIALSAAPMIGRFVGAQEAGALLLGPDEESAQWVEPAAAAGGLAWAVASKARHGDREVAIELPGHDVAGRAVVLMDDVASTGMTLVRAAQALRAARAASVDVVVTHGLFVGDAVAHLRAAGVRHIWSVDTVPHATNAISAQALIADALKRVGL